MMSSAVDKVPRKSSLLPCEHGVPKGKHGVPKGEHGETEGKHGVPKSEHGVPNGVSTEYQMG